MPSSPSSATGSHSERAQPGGAHGKREVVLVRSGGSWAGHFRAMACPCEVLVATGDSRQARRVAQAVAEEAWRVEDKFSRYLAGNVVDVVNTSAGAPVTVDGETANLLDFAARLHELSGGLFDLTSGVLRRAWTFDGGAHVPDPAAIAALLPFVGWSKVSWRRPVLTLAPGMQIDFGGIGKEYAVDQAAEAARRLFDGSCLVNFGGDLAVSRPKSNGLAWRVGIEAAGPTQRAATMLRLQSGAIATSGDTHRYVLKNGRRYTHILDPRTGCPVEHAPRCVTVVAETCTQAGVLTTLAILKGREAASFLGNENARHWIQW